MGLQEEIERIETEIKEKRNMHLNLTKELEEIDLKKTLLEAELIGLEQRRNALAEAASRLTASDPPELSAAPPPRRSEGLSSSDVTKLTMVDAIVHVINESDGPMQIDDVRRRLRELGRNDDPASVSVTLNYVATNGRIRRVARGLYGPL